MYHRILRRHSLCVTGAQPSRGGNSISVDPFQGHQEQNRGDHQIGHGEFYLGSLISTTEILFFRDNMPGIKN